MDVHVVLDDAGGTPGYVGERLRQLGGRLRELDRDNLPDPVDSPFPDLLLLLGSQRAVYDPAHRGVVRQESDLLRSALAAGVPVMGICYGTQLAAQALGGSARRNTVPEAGLVTIDSSDPVLCPPGPWVEMHGDTYTPPEGAVVLGRTQPVGQGGTGAVTGQGFSWTGGVGRFIGWQFHPEATPDVVDLWATRPGGEKFIRAAGTDPDRFRAQLRTLAPQLRQRAHALTDAALAWLQQH